MFDDLDDQVAQVHCGLDHAAIVTGKRFLMCEKLHHFLYQFFLYWSPIMLNYSEAQDKETMCCIDIKLHS